MPRITKKAKEETEMRNVMWTWVKQTANRTSKDFAQIYMSMTKDTVFSYEEVLRIADEVRGDGL